MKKSDIEILKKRFSESTEENYLKLVLESYSAYNHKARLDVARLLYEEFMKMEETEENLDLRKNLFAETFNKLMQSLEDSALLAVMFMDRTKTPFEHFIGTDNRMFIKFFRQAKRGFSNNQILRMYGLEKTEKLLKKGYIQKHERADFEKEFDGLVNSLKGEKERWKRLGKLYTQQFTIPLTGKADHKKSNVVAVYHNIKHAYKVLSVNDIFKKIWYHEGDLPPYLAVVEDYTKAKNRMKNLPRELKEFNEQKMVILGTFEVTKGSMKDIYLRIHPQAQTMKFISDLQLGKMSNPEYAVKEFRFMIFKSKNPIPKHYAPCPCGSGQKYKKCHQSKKYDLDDIIFIKDNKKGSADE